MLRETIYRNTTKDLEPLSREIEMDETMFGGKRPDKQAGKQPENVLSLESIREMKKC